MNAPPAVTYSAAIYALRCMVERDVPLNQGCLRPVRFIIPDGSVLNPASDAAVVGGNVLTSQRVVDVVLRAFGAAAASQGCMNNTTFGNASLGYYETVCGGCGAGPGWRGASGKHSHMTNTRITDPETLERRYPALLRRFHLRHGSGGKGLFPGGTGVVRELQFRAPLAVSVLTERRAVVPWGLAGGGDGKAGLNLLFRRASARGAHGSVVGDGTVHRLLPAVNLGSKATVQVLPGDIVRLCTPGAGAYGKAAGGVTSAVGAAEVGESRSSDTSMGQEWAMPAVMGVASAGMTSADDPGCDPWVCRWEAEAEAEAEEEEGRAAAGASHGSAPHARSEVLRLLSKEAIGQ